MSVCEHFKSFYDILMSMQLFFMFSLGDYYALRRLICYCRNNYDILSMCLVFIWAKDLMWELDYICKNRNNLINKRNNYVKQLNRTYNSYLHMQISTYSNLFYFWNPFIFYNCIWKNSRSFSTILIGILCIFQTIS